jgi:hypothetical protein
MTSLQIVERTLHSYVLKSIENLRKKLKSQKFQLYRIEKKNEIYFKKLIKSDRNCYQYFSSQKISFFFWKNSFD